MSHAKTNRQIDLNEPADVNPRDSGAGIVAVILACLLFLLLLAGAGVGGVYFYRQRAQRLALERELMMEAMEAERQAEMAAQAAKLEIARVRAAAEAERQKSASAASPPQGGDLPPAAEPSPEELFAAEIAPLNDAVAANPDDPQARLQRARALHRWRKWREAAEDYERFLEINGGHTWALLDTAATRFAAGDKDAYLAHCQAIEERLLTKPQGNVDHNRAARVLSLAPGALTQGDFFLVTGQEAPLKDPGKIWLIEPMLALQYRLGRYEEALQTLAQARAIGGSRSQRAAAEIWGALAYHQLGRGDEARQALATAEELIASGLARPGTQHAGSDVIIVCLHVIEEAKQLISGQTAPATTAEE